MPVCHALTLEIRIILYVWLGQGVTRVGNSMFSISLIAPIRGSCLSLSLIGEVFWYLVFCLVSEPQNRKQDPTNSGGKQAA